MRIKKNANFVVLKYELSGYWSRRINDEHRLVYKVTDTTIIIASCKYHY
ncbi:addiction module toxin RelE [Aliarcobacter cryaerophilus]|uniref:Putative mRNA interferase YoeB n=1 Tax=Aliarcobacter cryaerophilus TaxID=28198 RepID=A0A1V9VB50_9BACT|nr:addiction module toxin RelE [Aliarcobacter cryaerophilus]